MKLLYIFLFMVFITHPSYAANESNSDINTALQETFKSINSIAKNYGVSQDELNKRLREIYLESDYIPKYGKGGFSIIRDNIYIVNNKDINEMRLDKKIWKGFGGKTKELVIINNHKILSSIPITSDSDAKDFIFVLFNGDSISYFDWKESYGAKAYRK